MNTKDNIHTDRERLLNGVKKAANAVKHTLGAGGSNVIIESTLNPGHLVTNDGISVLDAIYLEDAVERIGLNLVKENASRSNKESGDGSTTATVIVEAVLDEGMKADGNPMEIKKSLDECLSLIHDSIDKQTKQITPEEVAQVATISAEDPELGKMIQDIYIEIGKDGIIELDNSGTFETHYEITDGVRLRNCGLASPYMAGVDQNGNLKKRVELTNPKVLITKQKINSIGDIDHIIKNLYEKGERELVIFCDEIETKALGEAIAGKQVGFNTIIIKAPTLWKDWLFEDFAKITGATIVNPSLGITFKNFSTTHFGICGSIKVTKDETVVVGIKDVSAHIENLKEAGKEDDQQLIRASWLQTKAATLFMGANSESELSYKRLKAEDAINASKLALMGGIVAGGGVCLLNVTEILPDTIGGKILKKALGAPIQQIMLNTGVSPTIGAELTEKRAKNKNIGFNAKTSECVDMWQEGIVDPALTQKNAVKNAISIAGIVLTAKVVVSLPR